LDEPVAGMSHADVDRMMHWCVAYATNKE